ncbi:MAG: hypothetical protein ACE15F_07375 [bacterium]
MVEKIHIDLYTEDMAQERFLEALIRRLLQETHRAAVIHHRSARGGHPRMLQEFKAYQKALEKNEFHRHRPGLLVLARDANCHSHAKIHAELKQSIDEGTFPVYVLACPDPYIERWYMADPESFFQAVGADCHIGKIKCKKDDYKKILVDAIKQSDNDAIYGGAEYALELVNVMDLYRAGKNERSLHLFIEEFHHALSRTS